MRVADYIFEHLADYGIKHVFLITGGGAMHLNDALKKEKRIKYITTHHEQAASIAAEGYARTKNDLAVVSVTSGPGGTNCLTGVIGQWLDSVPVLYISGQVKFETTIASVPSSKLRQLGDQEIDIVEIVKPVVKYAKMIIDPKSIKMEIEKAINIATSGRPGPVWLDIPLDVQASIIDKEDLIPTENKDLPINLNDDDVRQTIEEIKKAKRPVIIAGHGIKIADGKTHLLEFVSKINIPVLSTFNGFDIMSSNSPNFIGRIGTLGSRGGNFALQNSDLIICLGTRNNIRQISYEWSTFGRNAKIIIIDIDEAELNKKTVQGDILIHADAKDFLKRIIELMPKNYQVDKSWLAWCQHRKNKYPVVLDEYKADNEDQVNPYHFLEELTCSMDEDGVAVAGDGTACVVLFQAGVVKKNSKIFWNSGCAAMGYALPSAIGAAFASGKQTICIDGDGSLMLNLQELQTIKYHNLPIKIFVLNNSGYRSIEQTQAAYFNSDFIGCNEASGVSFPDFSELARLFGFKFYNLHSTKNLQPCIENILTDKGPVICEVTIGNEYIFAPKLSSEKKEDGTMISKPLEDLYPFLDRDEFNSNMIKDQDEEIIEMKNNSDILSPE
jgi:acetolactate synthase I/II/III large subunit